MAPSPSTLKWRAAGRVLPEPCSMPWTSSSWRSPCRRSASLQIGPMQAGLLATATLLGIGMSGLVMGPLADRGAAAGTAAVAGQLRRADDGGRRRHRLARSAGAAVSGLGLGSVWGIAAAHVNETWPAHQRARATSFVLSSFPSARHRRRGSFSCCPPMAGARALFFVCGAAVVIAMVYVWRYVPESETWLADRQQRAGAPQARATSRRCCSRRPCCA